MRHFQFWYFLLTYPLVYYAKGLYNNFASVSLVSIKQTYCLSSIILPFPFKMLSQALQSKIIWGYFPIYLKMCLSYSVQMQHSHDFPRSKVAFKFLHHLLLKLISDLELSTLSGIIYSMSDWHFLAGIVLTFYLAKCRNQVVWRSTYQQTCQMYFS